MKTPKKANHVDANPAVRAAFIAAIAIYGLAFGMYCGIEPELGANGHADTVRRIATYICLASLGLFGSYISYVVFASIGSSTFPSPASKLPARSRQFDGLAAHVLRAVAGIGAFAAIFLAALLMFRL